jgi:hypothetical protein
MNTHEKPLSQLEKRLIASAILAEEAKACGLQISLADVVKLAAKAAKKRVKR